MFLMDLLSIVCFTNSLFYGNTFGQKKSQSNWLLFHDGKYIDDALSITFSLKHGVDNIYRCPWKSEVNFSEFIYRSLT